MKIFHMYYSQSNERWWDIKIEIWACEDALYASDNKVHKTFEQLEVVKIHASKNPQEYHSCRFDHDLQGDSSTGHGSKSIQEFLERHRNYLCNPMVPITAESFNRVKALMLKVYAQYPPVDLEKYFRDRKNKNVTIL